MSPTKADRDLTEELGPSPWAMYEDEDEPWKDLKRLLRLEEKFDYQYEIAHVLGCDPSKISYWLGKAHEVHKEELRASGAICVRCDENETPGADRSVNQLCDECIDALRERDREADYDSYGEHLRRLNA